MGNLPQVGQPVTIPIRLSTPGHLMDHHFQRQPVLPAVEAMEALARTIKERYPDLTLNHLTQIRFDKFLPMDSTEAHLEAVVELQPSEGDQWQAVLATRTRAPKAGITRTKVHARVTFSPSGPDPDSWPLDVAAAPEGVCLSVPPDKIYKDLVPFGPAFQNIAAPIHISPDGVLAAIKTPGNVSSAGSENRLLGSPYALDAAMHGACVWSQHYKGVVAFPVAIDDRAIIKATQPGRIYYGRVRPQRTCDDTLIFDIGLLDEQGNLCEMVRGVHMRDVSGGRLQPPEWIMRHDGRDPLAEIKKHCQALTAVELDAMAPFARKALTPLEMQRFANMGSQRQKSFLAARLALKRLYRQCRPHDAMRPAGQIETVQQNAPLPCCTSSDSKAGSVALHCSVSHDRRLAVAAGDARFVGVDIETVSGKALRCRRIYMQQEERRLVESSDLGARNAALRIWCLKEAVAKAWDLDLAEAWQAARVIRIGDRQSVFMINGKTLTAHHATVDTHLVSLIVRQ